MQCSSHNCTLVIVKDSHNVKVETSSPKNENKFLMIEYTMGVQEGVIDDGSREQANEKAWASQVPEDDANPSRNTIFNVEINKLDSMIFNDKELFFIHD